MSLLGNSLMKVSPDQIILKKSYQQTNLLGYVQIQNKCDSIIAVKIKSNNPNQYIVAPSQVVLNPQEKSKIKFTKNGHTLNNIQYKADKFQFIAIEVDRNQVQMKIKNQPKVDDSVFLQKERRSQKIVLEVQIGSDSMYNIVNALTGSHELIENTTKSKTSTNNLLGVNSPQVRLSKSKNTLAQLTPQSNSDLKFSKSLPSQSQLKNPTSPSLQKSGIFDKDKKYKQEYQRLIQKVHEYEKNFQQLDQEIKMTRSEKDKWDQIQTSKTVIWEEEEYKPWHFILVILVSMLIGALYAK